MEKRIRRGKVVEGPCPCNQECHTILDQGSKPCRKCEKQGASFPTRISFICWTKSHSCVNHSGPTDEAVESDDESVITKQQSMDTLEEDEIKKKKEGDIEKENLSDSENSDNEDEAENNSVKSDDARGGGG